MDKAAIFIDNGYFKRILNSYGARGLAYDTLARWLCAHEKICAEHYRTYFYDCMPYQGNPPTASERERYSKMDKLVYSIRKQPRTEVSLGKQIRLPDNTFKQKGVDILLTIDLLKHSLRGDIQKAVLVACDSDFVPVVKEVRNEGTIVIVCFSRATGCGIHDELHSACDDGMELTQADVRGIRSGKGG